MIQNVNIWGNCMNSLLTMDFREDVYDHTADIYLRETFSLHIGPGDPPVLLWRISWTERYWEERVQINSEQVLMKSLVIEEVSEVDVLCIRVTMRTKTTKHYLWYNYISVEANITNQLHRLLQYINKSTHSLNFNYILCLVLSLVLSPVLSLTRMK